VAKRLRRASYLALFLDYDGTLAPLADHPSQAKIPAEVKRLLLRLSRRPGVWVGLVSGRALRDLKAMVGLKDLCYVGNHGLELQGPKLRYLNPAAQAARPLMKRIARELRGALAPIRGAWVEDKGLTLTVHHRLVRPEDGVAVKNIFYEAAVPHQKKGRVRVTAGQSVFELRPPVRWTKGTIVHWILARQAALLGEGQVLPLYVGDDLTDEDAFDALGREGLTVAVGRSAAWTQAQYTLRDTASVERLLKEILDLRRG
jgi:trehalose 6-phosphate phosphatase